MAKQWNKGSIAVHFEDAVNEKIIRHNYADTVQGVTPEQVEGFTAALEKVSALPSSYTVVAEEYRYTR